MGKNEFKIGKQKVDRMVIPISTIIEYFNDHKLDMNPPYQRGSVWDKNFKKNLIKSILTGIPINTIHLVRADSGDGDFKQYVLDGKQRLEAIRDFQQGEVGVIIDDDNDDNDKKEKKEVKYKDLSGKYKDAFKNFQISLCQWENMDIKKQKLLFEYINYSKPLTNNERTYCGYYLVKLFLKNMIESPSFSNFNKKAGFGKALLRDSRNSYTGALHSLLILCYGTDFQEKFSTKELNLKARKKSCDYIEAKMMDSGFDLTDGKLPQVENYYIYKKIKHEMDLVMSWYIDGINYKNITTKKAEIGFVFDILSFFIKKYQEKVLTNSFVKENIDKIYRFILMWFKEKNENKELKRRTTQKSSIDLRIAKLEKLFEELFKECDLGQKNKYIPKSEKTLALFEAPERCPVSNEILTDGNIEFDHKKPISLNSSSEIQVISRSANKMKNNLDLDSKITEKLIESL